LKIQEEAKFIKDYDLYGFHDINFTPVEGQNWEYSMLLGEKGDMEKVFTFERQPLNGTYPWENPNQYVKAILFDSRGRRHTVFLVPMGCTTLRITAFNGIRRPYDYCRLFDSDHVQASVELLKAEGKF
jgi:hypothetical protein